MARDATRSREAPPTILTTTQVAKQFGVTPGTVRRWIKAGELAAIETPGGRYRVPASEVERRLGPSAA